MGGIRGLERSAILAAALLVAGCGSSGSSPQTSASEASARATNTARPNPSATPGQASPSGSLPPGVTVVDTANGVQRLDWSPDGGLLAVLTWGAVFGNGRADILDLAGHTIGSFDAFDMAWMDDTHLMTFDVTPNDTAHGTVALHSTDATESAILPGTFGGMLGNGHGSVALMAPAIGSNFAADVSFRIWSGGQLGQSISGFGEPVVWSPDGRLLALISESPTGSGGTGGPIPGTLTVLQLPSRSVVLAHQFTDVRMDVYLSPDDSRLATSDGSVLNLTDGTSTRVTGRPRGWTAEGSLVVVGDDQRVSLWTPTETAVVPDAFDWAVFGPNAGDVATLPAADQNPDNPTLPTAAVARRGGSSASIPLNASLEMATWSSTSVCFIASGSGDAQAGDDRLFRVDLPGN
jgi:hypothetical protein